MNDDPDPERLRSWLAEVLDSAVSAVSVTKLAGGHSSGAWKLDLTVATQARALVLKAPTQPSVVFRRDAIREAQILAGVHRRGAPVPAVVAVDDGVRSVGRPCFIMAHVVGRSVTDTAGGYHVDPLLRAVGVDGQREVWESFHDAHAALHAVDASQVPAARLGDRGLVDVLAYRRESLLDAAPVNAVPRQVAAIDWLAANVPAGADDAPSVCLGDARLVNALLVGAEVRALVDFEVAYVGNLAADIAYSLLLDDSARRHVSDPLALPSPDDTWARWSRVTGRPVTHRDYWTAFAATILCVTASRAMIQWGVATVDNVEAANPTVARWESAVQRAARNSATGS